jgi:hypothetical protein
MKTKHGIFFGFAVMLAAAIFTLSGCDHTGGGGGGGNGGDGNVSTDGKLTVTGIPAEYNDLYIVALIDFHPEMLMLVGAESIVSISGQKVNAVKISGGSATLKVYQLEVGEQGISSAKGYAGNHTVPSAMVAIVSAKEVVFNETGTPSGMKAIGTGQVTFSNGVGTLKNPTFSP